MKLELIDLPLRRGLKAMESDQLATWRPTPLAAGPGFFDLKGLPVQATADAKYRHVHGLSRGLSILRALNDFPTGEATPRELSETTKLHRTTVKRILETLAEDGYVRSSKCDGRYGLAPEVRSLSCGLTDDAEMLSHCALVMQQLGRETGWSLRITTPQKDRMVIRESNHPWSDLSSEPWGGLRCSLPILLTAAGRAFFANCDEGDRGHIIAEIRQHRDEQTSVANNTKLVQQLTQRVLDDGYAINDGTWGERRLGAVAVPVRSHDGRGVASLSMLYIRGAVSRATIDAEFVPALRRSVERIEARF